MQPERPSGPGYASVLNVSHQVPQNVKNIDGCKNGEVRHERTD